MARKPSRAVKPSKSGVKAAADRAEKRAKGEPVEAPKVPIDPEIVAAEEIIRERGRPTDYKPEYVDLVRKWCMLGATDTEIAERLGVNRSTIYRWRLEHEDFCNSLVVGKALADDRVERSLYERAIGYEVEVEKLFHFQGMITRGKTREFVHPDPGSIKMWLGARRTSAWGETTRHEMSGPGGGPIQVEDVSKLDLARWIAHQLTQAQAAPKALDVEE